MLDEAVGFGDVGVHDAAGGEVDSQVFGVVGCIFDHIRSVEFAVSLSKWLPFEFVYLLTSLRLFMGYHPTRCLNPIQIRKWLHARIGFDHKLASGTLLVSIVKILIAQVRCPYHSIEAVIGDRILKLSNKPSIF